MSAIRALQAWWLMLIILLIFGILNFRENAIFPSTIGIIANLGWQYATFLAVRKRRESLINGKVSEFFPQVPRIRPVILAVLIVALGTDTALVTRVISAPVFALFAIASALLGAIFLTQDLSRLRKVHR